ncbi:MAG: protein phosphatase 2C domain-containing protein [Candidatus Nanoarchaeia archaeon]
MRVEHILDKGSGKINEDQILKKENLFAVFDGMTSLNKFTDAKKRTGGFLASSVAKEAFKKKRSLVQLTELANKKIKKEMIKNGIDISKKENLFGTALAAVRIKGNVLEWIQLLDCLIIVVYEDNSFKLLVEDYDADKEIMRKWKELGSKSKEDKWKILKEDIIEDRKKQNVNYGCLNGEKEYINFLRKGSISLQRVKGVILFTDGLIPVGEDPIAQVDFKSRVDEVMELGLKEVVKKTRRKEDNDLECEKFPRYKKHDDIGAILIRL